MNITIDPHHHYNLNNFIMCIYPYITFHHSLFHPHTNLMYLNNGTIKRLSKKIRMSIQIKLSIYFSQYSNSIMYHPLRMNIHFNSRNYYIISLYINCYSINNQYQTNSLNNHQYF